MSNQILYNVQNVYVGPHSDSQAVLLPEAHLLQRLYRIQSFNYGYDLNRSNIYELGTKSSINSNLNRHPDVSFEFDYYQFSVSNEAKMGMNPNYNLSGSEAIYPTGECIFSGYLDLNRDKDRRNFYIAINKSGQDGHSYYLPTFASGVSGYGLKDFVDPYSFNYEIVAFVNSYLTNISYNATVGDFPMVRTKFVADDLVYFISGSGLHVPILSQNLKSGQYSNYRVSIPRHYQDKIPSALKPGDITFSLTGIGYDPTLPDMGFNFKDCKLQNYSIDISIPREKLQFLGKKHPVDRPPNYPIPVNLSLEAIVGDLLVGSYQFTSISYANSWLKSTDGLYYAFRLYFNGAEYIFDIDQTSSEPAYGTEDYWIINCPDDGQKYKVYLTTQPDGIFFEVEQTPSGETGSDYKVVQATDGTFHNIRLVVEFGYIIIQIDQTYTGAPEAEVSGFGAHGSLNRLRYLDYSYDANIKIKNSLSEIYAGQETALAFDIKNLKLNSVDFSSDIRSKKTVKLNFYTEIDPDNFGKGLFLSGILNNYIVSGQAVANNASVYGEGMSQIGGSVVDTIYVQSEIVSGDNSEQLTTEDGHILLTEPILYGPQVF